MTELQYDFLCRYRAAGCPNPSMLSEADLGFLKLCKQKRWIRITILPDGNWVYRISELGLAAMLEYEQNLKRAAEQNAKEETQQREKDAAEKEKLRADEKKQLRRKLVESAFSKTVSFLFEHIADIVNFFQALIVKVLSLFH